MLWAGISYYGKISLIFIDKGVKVNADDYINKVLKLFLTKEVPRMFPGREKEMVFHEDSTSSHNTKNIIDFINKRYRVKFITTVQWLPNSPDVTPMVFVIRDILKRRLQKRKIYTMK